MEQSGLDRNGQKRSETGRSGQNQTTNGQNGQKQQKKQTEININRQNNQVLPRFYKFWKFKPSIVKL